jgi:hypothetical protein
MFNEARNRHSLAAFAAAAGFVLMTVGSDAVLGQSSPGTATELGPQIAPAATELSRAPHQEYVFTQHCAVGKACAVNFTKVPSSSRLDAANASCYIEVMSVPGAIRAPLTRPALKYTQLLIIKSDNTTASASTLVPISLAADRSWSANHAITAFATAGQRFQILIAPLHDDNLVNFIGCHVSGQMVRLR